MNETVERSVHIYICYYSCLYVRLLGGSSQWRTLDTI